MRWVTGLVLWFALLACAGTPGETVPAGGAPGTAPEPPSAPAEPNTRGTLPPGPVDGGWIGLAARPDGEGLTPRIDASLVLWDGLDALRGLPAGTVAEAAGPDGTVPVRLREIAEIAFGCDGFRREVAIFDGPRLPEGPVWLSGSLGRARSDPAVPTAQSEDRVQWAVGHTAVVTESDGNGGRTTALQNGAPLWTKDWKALARDNPLPAGAWVPDSLIHSRNGQMLLLSWNSMEGVHYAAVRLSPGDPTEIDKDTYLYWCAN